MKNIISKLKSRRRNQGSGLVLVIVAVAFIGILVGSLLTAVGYAYRLKLYDYNAKDNFYYLEQAMDEVYAGVGNQTLTYMQEAYAEVVNDMVKYDAGTKNYVTEDASVLNTRFKRKFLMKVASSPLLDASGDALDSFLRAYVTNSDVTLVKGRAKVVKYILDGTTEKVAGPSDTDFSSIVIKNVTLSRTANYNRSQANGDFTQTISTDIVISQPDFTMEFNSINTDYSTLFDYSMIADNGIEITQNQEEISISGNVYAASDFYNKTYNNYSNEADNTPNYLNTSYHFPKTTEGTGGYSITDVYGKNGEKAEVTATNYVSSDAIPSVVSTTTQTYNNFHNGPVTSKVSTTLRNSRLNAQHLVYPYDGVNENSMYSGLYIKGARVNMQSSELIVPGTIAILDGANFSLYGKTGMDVGEADVWADNVVLGGIGAVASYPKALIRGNLHVRDDLELDANYSDFQLIGRYYGFGDSTRSDARKYVPSVDEKAFFYTVTDGTTTNKFARGHYNSSAIVINGQQAKLNLSETNALFLAGRAYVELSKEYGNAVRKRAVEVKDESDNSVESIIDDTDELGNPITEKQYVFDGNTDDFKTGESVSLKTNQLAYVPINITGTTTSSVEEVTKTDGSKYYLIGIPKEVQTAVPFQDVLGAGTKMEKVPCVRYTTTDGVEYYYDFQTIYELNYQAKSISEVTFSYNFKSSETASVDLVPASITVNSAEDLAKQFILYYAAELTNYDESSARASLKDITGEYGGFKFDEGTIEVPTAATKVYSSGAITAKSGTSFTITGADNLVNALQGTDNITGQTSEYDKMMQKTAVANTTAQNVALTADDFEYRYAYVKWALENYNSLNAQSLVEMDYIKAILNSNDEGVITPINRYLNMNQITGGTDIHPSLDGVTGGTTFSLQSGYSVWISDQDVVVSTDKADGVVQGIVITKGSVFFDQTVSKFEGLIISGDKIFVDNLALGELPIGRSRSGASGTKILTSISASPEVVRAILNECMGMTGDSISGAYAKKVLNMFKSHENFAHMEGVIKTVDVSFKTIDTIQYSDVVRYNNWMKNVSVSAATATAGSGTTP